ncbi:hypothetical protein 8G_00009 [Ralstonia phage Hyacinthe]|uniref:Uncharacterized protein n=1 Tax=Ralstonia phage Hyacinthe TaxID=2759731 RepID=A0A7G5BAW8_9CAUD|nr:hypothetical protein 8G_00009 [Ralstonia phage Hyacinthe]
MSDYTGAPNTIPHAVGNGQMQELSAAQITTKYGSGNIKTPTRNFSINFKGMHIVGYKNVPMVCNAALLAALAATNAPVV